MRGRAKPIPRGWAPYVTAWDASEAAGGRPETTRRTRREHLARCARTIGVGDPWSVTGPLLARWVDAQSWATETRRCHRTTFRAFWAWGVETGQCLTSPALALPAVRPAAPRPRPCPDDVYLSALAAADTRVALMVRLAAEAGMRRGEVAQVHARDLIPDLAGSSLIVHGKGSRDRVVPITDELASRVAGQCDGGWAFPGEDRGHLSPRWVGRLVGDLLEAPWTMHTLRHRFATRTHEASGESLLVVQKLLGHASPETTRAYVAVPDERLRAAVLAAAAAAA